MTKDEAIKKVIEIAKKEVGYKEGKGNITKYAKYFDDLRKKGIDVYNYPKQGAEWCDIFVDWCFSQAFGVESGVKMLYQPMKSCGAGCKFSAEYFRNKKAFVSSPEIGDQIFFGKKGSETHTGLVVKVTDKMVYTIEGNKDNQVKECSYKRDNAKIVGYGRPDWKVVVGSSGASDKKEDDKKAEKPKSPEIIKYKVTAEHGLNIRKGPSTEYPRIATMPKGAIFEVQKIVGDWAYGRCGKPYISGYSCMKWLKKEI